jgi:hypothetical protein
MPVDLRSFGRLLPTPVRAPAIAGCSFAISLALLPVVDPAARPLALPLIATANLLVLYVLVLSERDGELPVCELGSVCVVITALYGSVPVLGYWLGGLRWSPFSDQRLIAGAMTPDDVGAVAWRYVVYLGSFVAAYLIWRGKPATRPSLPAVDERTESAVVLAIAGITTFFLLVFVRYGTSDNPAYASIAAGTVPALAELPPLVYFAARAGVAMLLVAKLCLLVLLFQRWGQMRYRVLIFTWLALEIVHAVARMGGRRDIAMLLMVAVLLYHRLVRPLAFWPAAGAVVSLLAGLLVFGFVRQGWGVHAPWSANNEFQVLFANAWDLLGRRDGLAVPWQIYVSDLLRLIPRDAHGLLPFAVLDPSLWYLRVLEARDPRVGLMFGVVAQSVIGWDWVELALRGAALGVIFAAIHRWHARSTSLWATVLYLYLCVWAYYTVRATTFHVASLVLWRLLPSMLVLVPLAIVLGRLRELPDRLARTRKPAAAPAFASLAARVSVPGSWAVGLKRPLGDQRFGTFLGWNAAPSRSVQGEQGAGGSHENHGPRRPRRAVRGGDIG